MFYLKNYFYKFVIYLSTMNISLFFRRVIVAKTEEFIFDRIRRQRCVYPNADGKFIS